MQTSVTTYVIDPARLRRALQPVVQAFRP